MPAPKPPLPERRCAFCDDPFIPSTGKQIYDCRDCQVRAERQRRWEQRQAERNEAAARAAADSGLAALK
jgi:hypothetical protein